MTSAALSRDTLAAVDLAPSASFQLAPSTRSMSWLRTSACAANSTAAVLAAGTKEDGAAGVERGSIVRAVAQSVVRDLCLQARRTVRGSGFAWSEFSVLCRGASSLCFVAYSTCKTMRVHACRQHPHTQQTHTHTHFTMQKIGEFAPCSQGDSRGSQNSDDAGPRRHWTENVAHAVAASSLRERASAPDSERMAMSTGGHERDTQSTDSEDSCDEEDESGSQESADSFSSRSWSQPEGPLGSFANEWSELAAHEFQRLIRGVDSNYSRIVNLMPGMPARNTSSAAFLEASAVRNSTLPFRVLQRTWEQDRAVTPSLNSNMFNATAFMVSGELREMALQTLLTANHQDMALLASGGRYPDVGGTDIEQHVRVQLAADFWRQVFVNGSATAVEEARDRAQSQGQRRASGQA